MRSSLRALIRKRPRSCACVVGGAGVAACAFFVEYRAETHQQLVLPREYDWDVLNDYWMNRPVTAGRRLVQIFGEMAPFIGACVKDFVLLPSPDNCEDAEKLQRLHSIKLREALTRLGPAFVKAGQQLSIRPDLVPPTVLKELQLLCDSVEPIPDDMAFEVIREELQTEDLDECFDGDLKLVASASLGQVYKAKLHSGEVVAGQ